MEKLLKKLKDEERRALIRLFTYPISQICNIALVVFVILKLTEKIDWSWWIVTSPIWGGFLVNVCIYVLISIIYKYRDDKV